MMKRNNSILLIIVLIFISFSCNKKSEKSEVKSNLNTNKTEVYPKYAKGFHVEYFDGYKVIEVNNPWDSTKIMYRYLLVPKGSSNIPVIPESVTIETPVNTIACLFTTQLSFILKLGITDNLVGMSRITYVRDSTIRRKIEKGEIMEFGEPENPDSEKLMAIDPDILMVSPFRDNKYKHIESAGIPLAVNGSYMESTPLGRSEWIKFTAYFFEMEEQADSIFNEIEKQYLDIKENVSKTSSRPSIFSGRNFNQVWHVAGANSYMGQYFKDAGFDYIWKDLEVNGSVPFEFELVYERCAHADYWSVIEYQQEIEVSYAEIEKSYSPYADFDAFKNKNIILCNSHVTPYFETGILEPHIVLADFVKVAHPEIVPNHQPKYFKILK